MSSDSWNMSCYPEPYKDVLVFDLTEGYIIGYYDNVLNMFYSKDNVPILMVSAWTSLPDKPQSLNVLRGNISEYVPKVN